MAASVQSQPPKPPPAPPKVESAPKADPKPTAEAKPAAQASAPRPAKTPDVFEKASGGGRPVPSNGGSSFTPAISAAKAQVQDALGSGKAAVQGAVNDVKSSIGDAVSGFKSDLQSALGSVDDAAGQDVGASAIGPQTDTDPVGFEDISDADLAAMNGFGDMMGGGPGPVNNGPEVEMSAGGAAGGVGDRAGVMNLQDTFSRNFGPWGGGGFENLLDHDTGGGGKPGIGGGMDFLNGRGGGAAFSTPAPVQTNPVQTAPSPASQSPFNFGFDFGGNGNGLHLGFFNFGSARGGGGGAAGGVADRSGIRSQG